MDLQRLGMPLRLRWLWFRRTDPDRPWAALPVSEDHLTNALFNALVRCILGNNETLLFWSDPWLQGLGMVEQAPDLFVAVHPRY
jgi:hypothetical protein